MLLGPIIGAKINNWLGYSWAFNCNGILLAALFVLAQVVYPYDPPLGQFSDGINKGAGSPITISTLLKRFNIFSIACCTACALYGFTFKESILATTMENFLDMIHLIPLTFK